MVNVNGNEITLALGIIAAILVVGSIFAMLIKRCCYKRKHREEEKMLDQETDNTSIQLPARGFSLLRAFSRAGRRRASAQPPVPSRATSLLRSLSRMTRSRSRRIQRPDDLESQITAYRSPSAAETRPWIHSQTGLSKLASEEPRGHYVYASRSQQWTQVALDSPGHRTETPDQEVIEVSPTSVFRPFSADFSIAGHIGERRIEPCIAQDAGDNAIEAWRRSVKTDPAKLYEPFSTVIVHDG